MHYNWKKLGKAIPCFLINKECISSLLPLFTMVCTLLSSKVGFYNFFSAAARTVISTWDLVPVSRCVSGQEVSNQPG